MPMLRTNGRVCLVTTGQPSTNPRLVKEADALAAAGYDVRVVCGHWVDWADDTDRQMLQSRAWSPTYVDGRSGIRPVWTRARYRLIGRALRISPSSIVLQEQSLSRVLPELRRTAMNVRADLYVAHNVGALPAAAGAAAAHGGRVAFDAEDFHSGAAPHGAPATAFDAAIEAVERRYLPRCAYVTAASPGIASAYAAKYDIRPPVPILNVFPLAQRPDRFVETRRTGPLKLNWFSQTIGPDRGLEDAVDAMAHAQPLATELHLRGIWERGYRERLLARCASRGVDPARLVSHPPASPDDMVRQAAAFDVGLALEQPVSRNREICLTNKIFTYLLAGNAVIGTATEAQQPLLARLTGASLSYRPGDVEVLAGAIRRWAEDRDQLDASRRAAWHWGEREYNWDAEQRKLLDLVASALQHAPASATSRSKIA